MTNFRQQERNQKLGFTLASIALIIFLGFVLYRMLSAA